VSYPDKKRNMRGINRNTIQTDSGKILTCPILNEKSAFISRKSN